MPANIRSVMRKPRSSYAVFGLKKKKAEECFQILRAANMADDTQNLLSYPPGDVKPEAIWNIEYGKTLSAADFDHGMSMQQQLFERLRHFMQDYEFVLCAVNQVPPFPIEWDWPHEIDGVPMETYISWMQSAYFITVTRSPAISVPAGFTEDGLPVGLQIVGRFRDDLGVLQLAKAFESATEFYKIRPAIVQ